MRSSVIMSREGEQGPQLPRIKCAFHAQQFLTNFCSCRGCLLPLCPSCIKIHLNEHISMKTNPQIDNINDLLKNLYIKLQTHGANLNNLFRQLVQVQNQIEQFREKLKGRLFCIKQELIAAVQDHFKRVEIEAIQKIADLSYVKSLGRYKDIAKRGILAVKNSERNFFSDESKIMRMMIKYYANEVDNQVQSFCQQGNTFSKLHHDHFLTFSVRDNFAQIALEGLANIIKIDISECRSSPQPQDFTQIIKELYEKQPEKKQIKKSLYKFLSSKNTPARHASSSDLLQTPEQSILNLNLNQDPLSDFAEMISSNKQMSVSKISPEVEKIEQLNFIKPCAQKCLNEIFPYQSVKDSIVKATRDLNFTLNRSTKISEGQNQQRRRSLSKGKGISIMQSNTTVIDFKKSSHNSIMRCEPDLTFINGRSELIPRKYR